MSVEEEGEGRSGSVGVYKIVSDDGECKSNIMAPEGYPSRGKHQNSTSQLQRQL